MKERLQKLMAMAGLGSRRANEELIKAGRVRVNGKTAQLGDSADLTTDAVEVDGVRLNLKTTQKRVYYAINKPRNVLAVPTNIHDDERRAVRDLLPYKGHLFSIGRLDVDSDGLVVLTNDGELAQKISHPRFRHTKTYRVVVAGLPASETLHRWETGVYLEEGKTAPCSVRVMRGGSKESILQIVMTEGKKRQIRRVASIVGHPVLMLTRIAIGKLELGNLKSGEWRELDAEDVRNLSTPSPDLKNIRRQYVDRSNTGDRYANAPKYPGAGKDDDVRSDSQRRAARHEPEPEVLPSREERPPRRPASFDARKQQDEERPRRSFARSDAPLGERPARRPARPDARNQQDDERPRRSFSRADAPLEERPMRRPARPDARNQQDDEHPRRSLSRDEGRDERPGAARPARRPSTRRDSDSQRDERPGAARPARRPSTRRDSDRPSSGRPAARSRRPAGSTPKPRRRPSQKRGHG